MMDAKLTIFILYMLLMILLFVVAPIVSFVHTLFRLLKRIFSRRRS